MSFQESVKAIKNIKARRYVCTESGFTHCPQFNKITRCCINCEYFENCTVYCARVDLWLVGGKVCEYAKEAEK